MKKITFLVFVLFTSLAFSQVTIFQWSGNSGVSDNIDQDDNWHTTGHPDSGDDLYFANTVNRSWPWSNYGAGSYFREIITFDGAGGIRWRGNVTYAFKFENFSDSNVFEIESDIGNRDNGDMELNPVGTGGITVMNNISVNVGNIIVYGDNTLTVQGVISGSGGFVIKNNSTVIFTSNNTYTGTTTLEAGTLKLQGSLANSDLTIKSGATLEIDGSVTLKSLTVESGGSAIVNSGKSLIISGTSSGDITYNRSLGTTNWYLVSSPVSGETIQDLITNHTFATGTSPNIGLAPYDNSQADPNNRWDYQEATSTGPLNSGTGYSVKLATVGAISFTGSMPTGDFDALNLTDNSGGSGNAFNLMGNPYPSFIASNANANTTNNILDINSSLLTEKTIWLWDQSASSYNPFNEAGTVYIAPGQGFFVSASGGTTTFAITKVMQSHQSPDSFQRDASTRPEIQLVMTDGTTTRDTDIFYISGTTTGFDNGYDSSIFGGVANNFTIYTHAVANGLGRDLGIQSLPDNDYENMVIPVGVNAAAGTSLSFTANVQNLPENLKVFLEDTQTNTFTQLNVTNGEYSLTLNSDMNGISRFYIHATSQTLSVADMNLDQISIYTTEDNSILNIVGLNDGKASIRLFDLTGKRILDSSFQSNRVNTITLPEVYSGIYIVQLKSDSGSLNKKIVID